ncbi:MAG: hypothetical protein JF603_09035 [Acidobacteria bacterium]|nr:hypothetical protein [Acidobacteriota bacterium]
MKIAVVVLSGLSAWAHSHSRSRRGLAIWGGVTGVSALGALFLGVLLHG